MDSKDIAGLVILALLALGFGANKVLAQEEVVLVERMVGQGGVICDTADEVKEFIDGNKVDGCGRLRNALPMRVTAVGQHTGSARKCIVVRYDFLTGKLNPPQFGIYKCVITKTAQGTDL